MKVKMKTIISIVLITVLSIIPFTQTANALDSDNQLSGLSTSSPSNDTAATRGTSEPSETITLSSKYNFSGYGHYSGGLFTNYMFTGKTRYTTVTRNTGSVPISVQFYKYVPGPYNDERLNSFTISPGASFGFTTTGLNSGDEIYLYFSNTNVNNPTFSFSGFIQ